MLIRFTKAATLKKLVEAVKDLINETNLICSSGGINLQAMDTSHVAMITFHLDSDDDCFERFECERSTAIGVRMSLLAIILKTADADAALELKMDGEDKLSLSFIQNNKQATYIINLLDLDQEMYNVDAQDYTAVISMPSTDFQKLCHDLCIMGDDITIESKSSDVMSFTTTGDNGTGKVDIVPDQECYTSIFCKSPIKQKFATKYLSAFAKATPLSKIVVLQFIGNLPISVLYSVSDKSNLQFFLAQKSDDND